MTTSNPRATTPGQQSLGHYHALLGVAVVVLIAGLVALVPGLRSVADLGVVDAGGEPGQAVAHGAELSDELAVSVRMPSRLVLGRRAPLEVRVGAAEPLGDDERLLLTFELDLGPQGAGWVVLDPARLLSTPAELPRERVELLGFGELPCTQEVGTLTVRARELAEDGRSGAITVPVPGASCHPDGVPEAPDSVHLQQRVWHGGDWRAQVQRLLTGGTGGGGSTAGTAPRPSGGGQAQEDSEVETEPDEDEDAPGAEDEPRDDEPERTDEETDPDRGQTPEEQPRSDDETAWEPGPPDADDGGGSDGGGSDGGEEDGANGDVDGAAADDEA
jgi:hypothetical protein